VSDRPDRRTVTLSPQSRWRAVHCRRTSPLDTAPDRPGQRRRLPVAVPPGLRPDDRRVPGSDARRSSRGGEDPPPGNSPRSARRTESTTVDQAVTSARSRGHTVSRHGAALRSADLARRHDAQGSEAAVLASWSRTRFRAVGRPGSV